MDWGVGERLLLLFFLGDPGEGDLDTLREPPGDPSRDGDGLSERRDEPRSLDWVPRRGDPLRGLLLSRRRRAGDLLSRRLRGGDLLSRRLRPGDLLLLRLRRDDLPGPSFLRIILGFLRSPSANTISSSRSIIRYPSSSSIASVASRVCSYST